MATSNFLRQNKEISPWVEEIVKDCFCFNYAETDFGIRGMEDLEAVTQKCSYEKLLWKYAANLQENTEVRFQQSCKATLLKSHFGMGVLL